MTSRCTHEHCFPDITCAMGHLDRTQCEHWIPAEAVEEGDDAAATAQTSDIPWNGYTLGTSDMAILGGRGRAAVIGLIGPPGSGKTSLLAFLYMWLLTYGHIGEWIFAGSWTLGGWESIVQHSRWTGEPPPVFPPHTSSAGRHPGMLHIAMRCGKSGQLRDILLTDAPGEWFTQWSRAPMDVASVGARWVFKNSDTLLLLIDSGALADSARLPSARRASRDLIDRVAADSTCPVAVVWTKDDIKAPGTVIQTLTSNYEISLPRATTLRTTVKEPKTIEACFELAFLTALKASTLAFKEPSLSNDPFLAYRGTYGKA